MIGYPRAIAKFERTTFEATRAADVAPPRQVALTIVHHADPARVGERAFLVEDGRRAALEVDRLRPLFRREAHEAGAPLDDPFLSRRSVRFLRQADGDVVVDDPHGLDVRVDGAPVPGALRVQADRVAAGVVVELGGRVVLALHHAEPALAFGADLGMIGRSEALERARRTIVALAQRAATPGAVLLRAETGSGKELAARALHEHGPRRGMPFVAVNLAAVPTSTAPAELFGHERGAFTGASAARPGFVGEAEGGTLFLDEIGEASLEVQAALLRLLDQREAQPVGGKVREVDVFVVAATDADLERMVDEGRFRRALLHRLQAAEVRVPPLRERKEDVGRLFYAFLAAALEEDGEALQDGSLQERPWPSAALLARLALHPWPGNVRQLRHFARRAALERRLGRLLGPDDVPAGQPEPAREHAAARALAEQDGPRRSTDEDGPRGREIDDDAVLQALRAHRFQLNKAAQALGVTRVKLDQLIEKHPQLRKAKDLSEQEIRAATEAAGGDVDLAAARLMVSPRGLRLRMTQLGIDEG